MAFSTRLIVFSTVVSSVLCFLPCSDLPEEKNTMIPEDPFAFVEDNLTLCCKAAGYPRIVTLYQNNVSVPVNKVWWPTRSAMGTVCMQRTVSVAMDGFYHCMDLRSADSRSSCLGYQSVLTDVSPTTVMKHLSDTQCLLEVSNFSYSFPDVRNRFSFPHHVSFAVHFSRDSGADRECDVTCKNGTCTCHLLLGKEVGLLDVVTINVTLTYYVTNAGTLRETGTGVEAVSGADVMRSDYRIFSVVPRESVGHFPRGLGLTATATIVNCLVVKWNVRTNNPLVWRLIISPVNAGNLSGVMDEVFEDPHKLSSRQVCGLASFTLYKVNLTCRLNYSRVWSPLETRLIRTQLAPPTQSPDLAPGYSMDGSNQAVFYWKAVPRTQTPVRYVITLVQHHAAQSRSIIQKTSNTYAVLRAPHNLDLEQGGVVRVRAENRAGSGKDSTPLFLARSQDTVPAIRAVVKHETKSNLTLKIMWPVTSFPVVSFTFLWCRRDGRHHNACEGEIDWVTVPFNATQHDKQSYVIRGSVGRILYGVSTQFRQGNLIVSSTFRWSACLYTTTKGGTLKVLHTLGCQGEGESQRSGSGHELLYVVLSAGIGVTVVLACCFIAYMAVKSYRRKKAYFAPHYDGMGLKVPAPRYPVHSSPFVRSAHTCPEELSSPWVREDRKLSRSPPDSTNYGSEAEGTTYDTETEPVALLQPHYSRVTGAAGHSDPHLESEDSADIDGASQSHATSQSVGEYCMAMLDDVSTTQVRYHEWLTADRGAITSSGEDILDLCPDDQATPVTSLPNLPEQSRDSLHVQLMPFVSCPADRVFEATSDTCDPGPYIKCSVLLEVSHSLHDGLAWPQSNDCMHLASESPQPPEEDADIARHSAGYCKVRRA